MKSEKFKMAGFTLVELLVVIAVLGILMAGIVIAIDPVQQMARARDAGRKSNLGQIGEAMVSYYTSHAAAFPAADANWLVGTAADPDGLVYAGELKAAPPLAPLTSGGSACSTLMVNNFCYAVTGTAGSSMEAVVWTVVEGKTEKSKCASTVPVPVWFFSSVAGKACGGCIDVATTALTPTQTCVF